MMNDLFPWVSEDDEIALNYMRDIDRLEERTEYLLIAPVDEASTEWSFPCGEKQPVDRADEEDARYKHRFLRDGLGRS